MFLHKITPSYDTTKVSSRRQRHAAGRVLLCGASSISGFHNFGDDLYTDIYVDWLRHLLPDSDISMLTFHGLSKGTGGWASQFEQADALLFIGGGYFGEPDHPGMSIFRRQLRLLHWAVRNYRLYGGAFHAARRHGVPHAVIGVGFGPIRAGFFRRCAVRVLREARVCALRDPESARYAKQYGVQRDDLRVHVDGVLSLKTEELPPVATAARDALCTSPQTFRIGLNLNSLSVAHWQHSQAIVRLILDLQRCVPPETPTSLYFLHDQKIDGQHPRNKRAAESFIKSHFPQITVLPFRGHWEMAGTLAAMHVVVTTKLHVGVTSRALSVPVLSIPAHQKTPRFYRFIGEQDFCIPAGKLAHLELPAAFRAMMNDWSPGKRYPVSADARRSAEHNRTLLESFISELPLKGRQLVA